MKFTPHVEFKSDLISVLILASITVKIAGRINRLCVDYSLQKYVISPPVTATICFVYGDNKDKMNNSMLIDNKTRQSIPPRTSTGVRSSIDSRNGQSRKP
jgi:hypothetical protein